MTDTSTPAPWPTERISYGGDYNPEQWPREVWDEDIALMAQAGVNFVTLGVFSWSRIEPADGEYDWEWLDDIIGRLDAAGIAVDLATPTAAPPPWLLMKHPQITPLDSAMVPRWPGTRLGWCPSSPEFRTHAVRIATALAQRYGEHRAVRLWHVSNELGGGNARCFCDVSAQAFRGWLREKYRDIAALNDAWGTAFWGHLYRDFAEIPAPRDTEGGNNPAHVLDYRRFSSDELRAHLEAEVGAIRAHSAAPITTNLMVASGGQVAAYSTWTDAVDVVSTDHYTIVDDPQRHIELSFCADRTRGLSGASRPWLLMEHSTGAPSWQQRNRAKVPGEILRNALAHIARGADGVGFFQWRASVSGAEQFHTGMLPHAGTNTRVWREVCELGDIVNRLAPIKGSPVAPARVALLMDDESAWSYEYGLKPHRSLQYSREPRAWYRAMWERNIPVDVIESSAPLDGYDVIIVPSMIITGADTANRIAERVAAGATAVVTYLSGVLDTDSRVITGGYPGAFRDLTGVVTEEFRPLQVDEEARLSDGTTVTDWIEDANPVDATTVLTVVEGPVTGHAALTRRSVGAGTAWYVAARLESSSIAAVVDQIITDAKLVPTANVPAGVEAVTRLTSQGPATFFINHTGEPVTVSASGTELTSGHACGPHLDIPAGAVRVVLTAPITHEGA